MPNPNNRLEEELLMKTLKNILLSEDRGELARLRQLIDNPKEFSQKVSPIVQEHLHFLKESFPTEYKSIINKMVQQKIKESQDDLLDAIYPQLGKMIKKFITLQFQMLKENIENQIQNSLAKMNVFARVKTVFFGSKVSAEEILSQADKPVIEEVYLIQRDSGLLLGHASYKESINRDIVAGMLTAIKAFVEDAFQKGKEDLEMIEYGSYKIFIQSFYSYYIAIAFSGSFSATERDELSSNMFDFAELELNGDFKDVTGELTQMLSEKLEKYFLQPRQLEKTDA